MNLAEAWWQTPDALARWLTDFIRTEAGKLRPGLPMLPLQAAFWPTETRLDAAGLGLDSIERLQIAAAVSEALLMHRSGVADWLLAHTTMGEWCATVAASLGHFSREVTFHTSGSTGAPKAIVHNLADLEAEAAGHAAVLGGLVRRVLSAVPCHHIYGFIFTIVLPRHLGRSPVLGMPVAGVPVLDLRPHSPAAAASLAQPGDLIVGFPEFWAAVARAAPQGWPGGVIGVSSTAPLPDCIADALRTAGLTRLLQIHGSSETAGLGLREASDAPYALLPGWRRTADDRLARASSGSPLVDPPDTLEWLDGSRYHVTDRKDGAVQVAGLNVFPRRVEAILCDHALVAAAAVRLMRPDEGTRLKAFIVPRDPAADPCSLRNTLHAFAATRLATPEQPRAYTIGPALPLGALGKPADWTTEVPEP